MDHLRPIMRKRVNAYETVPLTVTIRKVTTLALHAQRAIHMVSETMSHEKGQFQRSLEASHLRLKPPVATSQEIH